MLLTPDQESVRDAVRAFAQAELKKGVATLCIGGSEGTAVPLEML